MLLYLKGHTRPNIFYAINFCDRYILASNNFHESSLRCIGCYLKSTMNKELFLNPFFLMCKIDCFPDADFSGMYGHGKPTDP